MVFLVVYLTEVKIAKILSSVIIRLESSKIPSLKLQKHHYPGMIHVSTAWFAVLLHWSSGMLARNSYFVLHFPPSLRPRPRRSRGLRSVQKM